MLGVCRFKITAGGLLPHTDFRGAGTISFSTLGAASDAAAAAGGAADTAPDDDSDDGKLVMDVGMLLGPTDSFTGLWLLLDGCAKVLLAGATAGLLSASGMTELAGVELALANRTGRCVGGEMGAAAGVTEAGMVGDAAVTGLVLSADAWLSCKLSCTAGTATGAAWELECGAAMGEGVTAGRSASRDDAVDGGCTIPLGGWADLAVLLTLPRETKAFS